MEQCIHKMPSDVSQDPFCRATESESAGAVYIAAAKKIEYLLR